MWRRAFFIPNDYRRIRMKIERFDAVVIGSGCAGYNCADWLYDLGCRNIAVVTEGLTYSVLLSRLQTLQ